MNGRLKQLRDLVVALDRSDRNLERMSPEAYREAARAALALTHEEMGLLPICDFAGPVSALQTFAENIFFGLNGRFADLDATGRAPAAFTMTRGLVHNLRLTSPAVVDEIAGSLFARLRAGRAAGRLKLA
ncbi:MAG: hypothetical protein ABIO71_04280 [Caldimonas sp.]